MAGKRCADTSARLRRLMLETGDKSRCLGCGDKAPSQGFRGTSRWNPKAHLCADCCATEAMGSTKDPFGLAALPGGNDSRMAPTPSLAEVEQSIGIPAPQWQGRCYEIAGAIVKAGLVKGRAVYGHYRGPVDGGSIFYAKSALGFVQHGWVVLEDGRVFDPTRWAFECRKPYLFVSPDHKGEYDEGGNRFRMDTPGPPPSIHDETFGDGTVYLEGLSDRAWERVSRLLKARDNPDRTLTTTQAAWLAKVDPKQLGDHAVQVFRCLVDAKMEAFIPIDNRLAVLGDVPG